MRDFEEKTAWFASYAGLDVASALALGKAEGRVVRVITPDTVAVDLDYRLDRLNVHLGSDGELLHMAPG